MRTCTLEEIGFPNVLMQEDGRMFDLTTNKEIGNPESNRVQLKTPDGSPMAFTRTKLYGLCFRAPWHNGIHCTNLGFLGLSKYFVTVDGHVFGVRNMDYVQPKTTKDGYFTVNLYTDSGDYIPWRVHRLVAITYIPNPENKDTVDHKNNIRTDNRVDNLRWMWMWENSDHRRESHGPSDEKIREICTYLQNGMTQTEAARAAGVGRYIVKDLQYGSYYRISKDYVFPRYAIQKRMPVEFSQGKIGEHGQQTRTHLLDFKF